MSELRLAFVHQVVSLHQPVSAACRQFGISRKTGYKWLARYRAQPGQPLVELSRRPLRSPGRTSEDVEQAVLEVRDRLGWGPRKIHAYLRQRGLTLPSSRTLAAVLQRHGRSVPQQTAAAPCQHFEHPQPNDLWQCDFKAPLEVARQRLFPFTVLDDHSRYLLTLYPARDQTMATAWDALWEVFGRVGLPRRLLCDNAFGTRYDSPALSWFEARLLRLDIHTSHGRPYHPQTQGKDERLHGTLEREVWPRVRRDTLEHFTEDTQLWRTTVYNVLRPHESLADLPPLARWRPSPRPRPATLPPLCYPEGAVLRKVTNSGRISWHGCHLLAGKGIVGDYVRIVEGDGELLLYYARHVFRRVPTSALQRDHLV